MVECQGKCGSHRGTIKRVEVRDIRMRRDWGLFWYCDEAIEEDIRRGLDVSILDYVSPPTVVDAPAKEDK